MSHKDILVQYHDKIVVITLNNPQKRNSMTFGHWTSLAARLNEVSARPEVICTIITGEGNFFSAGADVQAAFEAKTKETSDTERVKFMSMLGAQNMDLAVAFYSHRPILVAALNGPAIGLSAALLGYCDFIHAVKSAYLFMPFATLGLVAEGGASHSLPLRLGINRANKALILGQRLDSEELLSCGFFSKVYEDTDAKAFHKEVLEYFQDSLSHLDSHSVVAIKALIQKNLPDPHPGNMREILGAAEVFASGRPQEEFGKFARKEKRHRI